MKFTIRRAKGFILAVTLFYLTTLILIIICRASLWTKSTAIILSLVNSKYYLELHCFKKSRFAVVGFWKTTSEFWCLVLANHQIVYADLIAPSFSVEWLTILKFVTEEHKKLRVIVTPRCIGMANYRRLLAILLHGD